MSKFTKVYLGVLVGLCASTVSLALTKSAAAKEQEQKTENWKKSYYYANATAARLRRELADANSRLRNASADMDGMVANMNDLRADLEEVRKERNCLLAVNKFMRANGRRWPRISTEEEEEYNAITEYLDRRSELEIEDEENENNINRVSAHF